MNGSYLSPGVYMVKSQCNYMYMHVHLCPQSHGPPEFLFYVQYTVKWRGRRGTRPSTLIVLYRCAVSPTNWRASLLSECCTQAGS